MRKKDIFRSIYTVLFFGSLQAQTPVIDSLLNIAETSTVDTIRIKAYLDAVSYLMDGHPDRGIQYAKTALALARKSNDRMREGDCLKHIGICYDYKGDLDSCFYYVNQSIDVFAGLGQTEEHAMAIADIAIAYYVRGNYEMALRYYFKSADLLKNVKSRHLAKTLNNIGLLYKARKDYDNAIRYFKESVSIKEEHGDEGGLVNTYMNIGSMYQSKKQADSALLFAQKCFDLAKKLNRTDDMAGASGNKGEALFALGRFEESEMAFKEGYRLAKTSDCHNCMPGILHGLAELYVQKKQYSQALELLYTAVEMCRTGNKTQQLTRLYNDLSDCYRAMGDFRMALKYRDSLNELSDKVLNEENIRQINELSTVYETAEKEKKILALDLEKNSSIAEALRRKEERNYFIIATLLVTALAVVAFRAYASNKKKKELLNRQNIVIEASLRDKEILLKEIHHRVKNNLQMVSSLLSLQTDYIKDEYALDAVKESRNRVHSMALIHQNLYQEDNLTGIAVDEYIGKLCDNLFQSYNIKPGRVNLVKEVEALTLDVDVVVPLGLIINELITNCLKYAFPGNREGMIKLILKEDNKQLRLFVYDNGIGFLKNPVNEVPSTFGFKMIHAFVQKMKGQLNIYTEDGARVEIILKEYKHKTDG